MAKTYPSYNNFEGGIADFVSEGIPHSFDFAQSVDVRSDPKSIGVLPRTIKESGTTIVDLPKWAETYNANLTTYFYGDAGNIYSRTSAGSYTFLRLVGSSHGNGLVYSQEDDFLYYALDKVIGRYGPLSSASPTFTDDFLGSLGGVPLNTASLDLESSSSQYASRADTASLSITGNIAFDLQIKPESLPAAGSEMVLVSKWDESGTLRSYKLSIVGVSAFFGDGSDSTLTISSDTTEAPIDSACTGTINTTSLSATNASFASGQKILIHQTRGTGAGNYQRNEIASYTAGTITLVNSLNVNYVSGAQVRVLKQYSAVTIDATKTYTAKAWNGTVGGILAWLCNGTTTINGTVTASGKGFRGGVGEVGTVTSGVTALSGEGTAGASVRQVTANGNGGGGGYNYNGVNISNYGGGGAGNGTAGTNGSNNQGWPLDIGGRGGATAGASDLSTIVFGGGGGAGIYGGAGGTEVGDTGGAGGGIAYISSVTLTMGASSSVVATGGNAVRTASSNRAANAAGGAGGSILFNVQTATLGTLLVTSGAGTTTTGSVGPGGQSGVGRIAINYYTSYTGTTTPTANSVQDNTLANNLVYQLRLSLSSTGLNSENLSYEASLATDTWQQVGVSWKASTSTATFFLNATTLGTRSGAFTAIHDNASTFQIGMSKSGAGAAEKFYDGLMDEVRLFAGERTESDMLYGLYQQIAVNTSNLNAYYKLNGDYTDATANANTLTASGSPVFVSDVPFASPTTRLDIDQTDITSSQTYAVPTAISETSTNRKTFTPTKDPQKSIQFNVANIGTGTWTVVIHDVQNNLIATVSVLTANMHTGNYEFVFDEVWSPLTNFTQEYHAHVICASGSPTIVSGTSNDMTTAAYTTFYQFLVENDAWHPMIRFLNFWVVGNGRYINKYEAPLYTPNLLTFQAGLNVRCFGYWREYLAIGVTKGNTVYEFDYGRIYFWDGSAPTFNFYIDVPEGGINSMLGSRGRLYIWAGYKNQLLVYEGGDSAQKIKDMRYIEPEAYSEIFPQASCMWQSLIRYGVAGGGNSEDVQKGVYTFGSTNLRYPEVLTYDYPISTGNIDGTEVKVGVVTVVNQKLLIGWKDGTGYGVDYVANDNPPFASSYIQFLIEDLGAAWKEKESLEVAAYFSALETGEAVALSYAIDGSSTFTPNADTTSVGEHETRQMISQRNFEFQIRASLTSDTTAPSLKAVVATINDNVSEGRTV